VVTKRPSVFSDVPYGSWAWDAVEGCYWAGVVQGYPDGSYQPESPVTRDQMAVFVARAMGVPSGGVSVVDYEPPSAPSFPDVPTDYWAYRYIEYCRAQGIVRGYGDGYHPEEEVSRGQMAVFVARGIAGGDANVPEPPEGSQPRFPDVPADYWAYRWIEYCASEGVVAGYPDGTYGPEVVVARDQMAMFIARGFRLGVPRVGVAAEVQVQATIQGPPAGNLAADLELRFYEPGGAGAPIHTRVVSLDDNGQVTTTLSLRPGTYDVWGKVPTHLARRLRDWSLTTSGAALDFGTLLAGDLVNDNVVDRADLDYMTSVWGTDDPVADINRDGVVNSLDFSLLNSNWGVEGDW